MNDAAVRQILDEIQKSKDELKNTIIAKVENSALKNKLEILERDNKLNNIVIFFGLNKTNEEVQANTIADELKKLLEIELSHQKKQILKNAAKLKGTKITISNDLTIKQREDFRTLRHHQAYEKQNGKTVT
ncbi:hypothetical protein JTB14_017458 [Gonioctena quinquepunctata]|nr:hypothetical protein JTB14_017458 [Gonioctena quinquepunctata]